MPSPEGRVPPREKKLQPSPYDGQMVEILPPGSAEGADDTIQDPNEYRPSGMPMRTESVPRYKYVSSKGGMVVESGRKTFPLESRLK